MSFYRRIGTTIGGATCSARPYWLDDTTNGRSRSGSPCSPTTVRPAAWICRLPARLATTSTRSGDAWTRSWLHPPASQDQRLYRKRQLHQPVVRHPDPQSEVSALGYQTSFDWGMWHPFVKVVWDYEFDPLDRLVTASLTTMAAPSYSLPAVVLGRDWATTTVGTKADIRAGLERACFLHGAARPKSCLSTAASRARLLVRRYALRQVWTENSCPRVDEF